MNKTKRDIFRTILLALLFLVLSGSVIFTGHLLERNMKYNKELTEKALEEKQPETKLIPVNIRNIDLNDRIKIILENPEKEELLYNKIDYFTGNRRISEAITKGSINYNIPIGISMGIAWTESRFNSLVVNQNGNNTKDWGLFQLNDVNTKGWTEREYFNVDHNTKRAMEILKELFSLHNENIIIVIAAYNAGSTGIKDGISYKTLFYINSVLSYKDQFEKNMNEFILNL